MQNWQINLFKKVSILILLILLAACSPQGRGGSHEEVEPAFNHAIEKLVVPWSITKKADTFYISERSGAIVTIHEATDEMTRLPVKLKETIHTEGEGGSLGLELIPGTELEAFAYHTYEKNGQVMNRVVRIEKGNVEWIEKEVVINGIPGAAIHNGGRMKIGPDDKLYVTTGDAANPEAAQNLDSLAGKILRLNLDGTIPNDNPFPNSSVFSYGHRNPQGLAWDDTGQLYATEHGQSAHDEINGIEAGKNYGWPLTQGDEMEEGMVAPLFHTNGNTWAPSGTAFHNGKLYIATLRGEAVRTYNLVSGVADIFSEGNGRIRDVFIEDGTLYFITNNTDGRGTPAANDDRMLKVELNRKVIENRTAVNHYRSIYK